MTKTILLNRKSFLMKFVLLVTLLVGGDNLVFADSYTCGFESSEGWSTEKINYVVYTTPGDGWGVYGDGSSTLLKTYLVSDGAKTGSQSLATRSNSAFYAVTPKLAEGTISFYAKNNGGNLIKVYKATFDGSSYVLDEEPIASWKDLNSSFVEKSFDLDEDSYVAFFLSGAIIDDFCASSGLAIEASVPTSFTASPLSYSSVSLGWTAGGDETEWQIKYNANSDFNPDEAGTMVGDNPVTSNPYTLSGLLETTTYYVYVRAFLDESTQSSWVGTNFTTPEQYPSPTSFAVSEYTESTAKFNWINGNDEDSWQIVYSTVEDFNPDDATPINVDSNPYTLTRLEGTTYYAYMRANYGGGNFSDWSNEVSFFPSFSVNSNSGTDENQDVAIHNNTQFSSKLVKTQFIIPSSSLISIRNSIITSLSFYTKESNIDWGTAEFEVYLKETSNTEFTTETFETGTTKVLNSTTLAANDGNIQLILDNPFKYTNSNLLVGITQTATSATSVSSTWYGSNTSINSSIVYYGSSNWAEFIERKQFIPKLSFTCIPSTTPATIGSTGYTTFASTKVLDLDNLPSGLKAYYAASDAVEEDKVKLTVATGSVPAGEGLILKGTADVLYNIPIADGDGTALDGNLLVGCTTPKALAVNANDYVLVNNAGTPEFQDLSENGATIPAGKAYLNASGAGSRLSIVFDDPVVTGIAVSKMAERSSNGIVYNMMGQKVVKPSNGLYVINGKKVIKK